MTVVATVAWEGCSDLALSTQRHISMIEDAASAGARLVIFPEISLQGYPPDFGSFYPERVQAAYANAESVPDGPHVQMIVEAARRIGTHVIFGLNERGETAGVIYNTAVLTGPEGFIGKYRKVHVGITEQLTWRCGNDWPVFRTEIGRIGMLICYDKVWPESSRELTLRGADILVMPTAWFMAWGDQSVPEENILVRQHRIFDSARAAENNRWFISSNYAGPFGGANFIGLSQIVDPCGMVVAATTAFEPGVAMVDIDIMGGIAHAQSMQGARIVRDRRAETYRASRGEIPIAIDG